MSLLGYVRLLRYSYGKERLIRVRNITVCNIFNTRGTKIYDVFIAHRNDQYKNSQLVIILAKHTRKITVY